MANATTLPTPQRGGAGDIVTAQTSYSSAVIIEELAAPTGKKPRSITLQGPSLPLQGANWGGENNLKTTWYAGNGDEATQQDMGPMESPSNWKGDWRRTMMGKSPTTAVQDDGSPLTIVDPLVLANLLEDIFRTGMRLRVTWSVSSNNTSGRGKIIREGRCAKWDFQPTRVQDIEWTATFAWQSRGARTQTVTNVRDGALDAQTAAMNIANANLASSIADQNFSQSNSNILNSATHLTLGQLESLANLPLALMKSVGRTIERIQSQLEQVAGIAITLASQPAAVVNAAINTAKNAIAAANQFVAQLGRLPIEIQVHAAKGSVSDLIRAARYFGQVSDATVLASRAAQNLVDRMRQSAPTPAGAAKRSPTDATSQQGDLLAVYSARDGDTPQRLSQRFYGSPDHAVDILQANRLPWYQATFLKGQVLIIPVLKTSQRGP